MKLTLGCTPIRRWLKPPRLLIVLAVVAVVTMVIFYVVATPGGRISGTLSNPRASYVVGGGKAPSFALADLQQPSRRLSLASLRGHLVVLNFWASWCVPCRNEMPLLERTYRQNRVRVIFLGIDTNDTRSAGLAFARKVGVTYQLDSDPNAKVAIDYGIFGLPTTFFIGENGRIVGREIGELHPAALAYALAQLKATPATRPIRPASP